MYETSERDLRTRFTPNTTASIVNYEGSNYPGSMASSQQVRAAAASRLPPVPAATHTSARLRRPICHNSAGTEAVTGDSDGSHSEDFARTTFQSYND